MQGCDLLELIPVDVHTESRKTDRQEREHKCESCGWSLSAPPLREEVVSMQHWLDLNA